MTMTMEYMGNNDAVQIKVECWLESQEAVVLEGPDMVKACQALCDKLTVILEKC